MTGFWVVIVVGLVGSLIWGIVILFLAKMGIDNPKHQRFLIELAKSKKINLPTIVVGKMGSTKEETRHDIAEK